jgi:hypothetical protein
MLLEGRLIFLDIWPGAKGEKQLENTLTSGRSFEEFEIWLWAGEMQYISFFSGLGNSLSQAFLSSASFV